MRQFLNVAIASVYTGLVVTALDGSLVVVPGWFVGTLAGFAVLHALTAVCRP